MSVPDPSCLHDRVVRLEVQGRGDYWICTVCNEQFIPKRTCDFKMAHLAGTVYKLTEKLKEYEQTTGVRRQEGLSQ